MKNKIFKIKKRFLSVALAMLLIFGMIPNIDLSKTANAATLNYDLEKYIPVEFKISGQTPDDDDHKKGISGYNTDVMVRNNNGFATNISISDICVQERHYDHDNDNYVDGKKQILSAAHKGTLYGTTAYTRNISYSWNSSYDRFYAIQNFQNEPEVTIDCLNVSQPVEFNGIKTYAFKNDTFPAKNDKVEILRKDTITLTTHKGKPGGVDGDIQKNYLYAFTIPKTMSHLVSKYTTVKTKPIIDKILKSFNKADMPEFVPEKDSVYVTGDPIVVKCVSNNIIGEDWSSGEKKDITTSGEISLVLIPDTTGAGGSDFDSSELEAKISELEKQIKDLNTTIDEQKTEINSLKEQNPKTEEQIKELENKKKEMEAQLKENNSSINSLKDQLSELQENFKTQNKNIKDLNSKLEEMLKKNEALTNELALAKAKEDAKTEIKAIKDLTAEQIAEFEKKVDEATSEEAVKAIVEEAKKQAETNKASEEEKAQALAKAKEDAKTEIKAIEGLTAEQIAELEKKVDEATSDEAVKAIVEEAKKQAETNKASEEEKAQALAKAKEDAKTEIKAIEGLTAEQIAELEKKVDEATSDEAVKAIVEEAKKQAETNKASEEEKAKEEALKKAKEEELARAKEEALKKAKEEELAKELAKKNENDPEYQKNKLSKLLEEAKRLRHPSEELEAAIDEAYDILLDKYARLEDYKYAIEKIERILQNRRDTRRNRFKLDVDDLNEKDTELTGKTGAKWYIDVYNGKKCILSGQANYKGDFSIEIKKGKIKAKDKLKVVATDPQDDKKYKEVEIEVGGDGKENKENKSAFDINDLLQADGSNSLSDLAIFPVGRNYYNVIQNNQKTTVYMDVKSFISGNRAMLPIRYIAYTLGFNVEYDSITREAIFSNTENSALAKKTIWVNIDTGLMRDSAGRIYSSDVRPVLINNRIHASIANIARMFEASQGTIEDGISQTIEWDNARKAVYVFKNVR